MNILSYTHSINHSAHKFLLTLHFLKCAQGFHNSVQIQYDVCACVCGFSKCSGRCIQNSTVQINRCVYFADANH